MTIETVLEILKQFIDIKNPLLEDLEKLARAMLQKKTKTVKAKALYFFEVTKTNRLRPNMKEVLDLYLDIMTERNINKDKGPNQTFFEQATKWLQNKERVII